MTRCLVLAFAVVLAATYGQARFPDWDKLTVTWGIFSGFHGMPYDVNDAVSEGWVLQSKCEDSNHFRGNRYIKNRDPSLYLLFDSNGQIAGVQFAVPKTTKVAANQKPPFVLEDGLYHLTAYFIEPSKICSAPRRDPDYVGDKLLIQIGDTYKTLMPVPLSERNVTGTAWVKGKCFYSMGQHYWYKISNNMNCDDFFPVFLLYNKGKLNGFGWATGGDIQSSMVEHPTASKFKYFFQPETLPACLSTIGPLTTQHVFLDKHPRFNFC